MRASNFSSKVVLELGTQFGCQNGFFVAECVCAVWDVFRLWFKANVKP